MSELPKELQDALAVETLPKTDDFEVSLMQFLYPWIALVSLDKVIEGLDRAVETLEQRRDLELAEKSTPQAPSRK